MLSDLFRDALALLAPVECAGCGAADRALCGDCSEALEPLVISRTTPTGIVVHTALRYESVVRRAVLAYKEEGRTDVARSLSRPLAGALQRAVRAHPSAIVVPVPSSRAGYRRRGYDPVRLLLRRTGVWSERMLRATRRTAVQKSLGREDRAANVVGAYTASAAVEGRSVILVDDVLTTGATLDEAARAIAAAGGTVVAAATMAFTPRLHRSRDIGGAEDYGGG